MDFITSELIQQHMDQLHREANQSRLAAVARRAARRNRRPASAGARHASVAAQTA